MITKTESATIDADAQRTSGIADKTADTPAKDVLIK